MKNKEETKGLTFEFSRDYLIYLEKLNNLNLEIKSLRNVLEWLKIELKGD